MKQLILGSGSPRRAQLLREIGFDFDIRTSDIDEIFDPNLKAEQLAISLAEQKNQAIQASPDEILLTADTVVALDQRILGKPADEIEGAEMLEFLSANTHQVITGVCVRRGDLKFSHADLTEVTFKRLAQSEIQYYLKNFQPYDKAGGYGIQEWLGQVAIERIRGSYYNVVGLPTHLVYQILTEKFEIYPSN